MYFIFQLKSHILDIVCVTIKNKTKKTQYTYIPISYKYTKLQGHLNAWCMFWTLTT